MRKNKELIEVNELSKAAKASMITRVISALVAVIIAVPCLMVGDWFAIAFISFLSIVAAYEIVKCAKPKHSIWLFIIASLFTFSLAFWPMIRQLFIAAEFNAFFKAWTSYEGLYLSLIVFVIALFVLFFFVLIDTKTTVSDASFIFTVCFIVAFGVQCATYLRYYPIVNHYGWNSSLPLPDVKYFNIYENLQSSTLFFYVVGGSLFTDIGAYFVGIFFGKHKMNERISPKKTWEGFFGGIFFSMAASFIFAFVLALNGNPLTSFLGVDHWHIILLLSALIPIASTLGDFVFSSFKRFYGIKDFGNIMPGHGGVLDRVDSVIFACIITAVVIFILSGSSIPLV